jgi:BlaI family transcriptional regulator, penicillinase repressor
MDDLTGLSRRERQIMDAVFRLERATATQVVENIPDPPSRTAVRTILTILEDKGHLAHVKAGREYVYMATRPRKRAGQSALRRVVDTFFGGSLGTAVAAHLADPDAKLSQDELHELARLVREAKKGAKR